VAAPEGDGAVVDPVDVWHSFPENPALHTQTHPAHLPFPLHTTAVCLFPAEAKLGPEITFAAHEGEVAPDCAATSATETSNTKAICLII
jgi:hypothetical protein